MRLGYGRISTKGQSADSQIDALTEAGCDRLFVDEAESSRAKDRPEWLSLLDYARPGDTVVVWRLDRLAGTETMAIQTISELHDRGLNITSLTEPDIDTTTPMGRALFGIVAVFAQLRVDTIRQNTRAGLDTARARGKTLGRPPVMTDEKLDTARQLLADGMSKTAAARTVGVSRPTLYRHLDASDHERPIP